MAMIFDQSLMTVLSLLIVNKWDQESMPRTSQSILFRFFKGLRIGLYKSSTTQVYHNFKNMKLKEFSRNRKLRQTCGEISVKASSELASPKSISEGNTCKISSLNRDQGDKHVEIFDFVIIHHCIITYVDFLPHASPVRVC